MTPRRGQDAAIVRPRQPAARQRPGANAVYAWGLRNPWRFSFDRLTGNLALADVGDNGRSREEIDLLSPAAAAGANFGWPEYEGLHRDDPRPARQPAAW